VLVIINVPTAEDFTRTGSNLLNLAWSQVDSLSAVLADFEKDTSHENVSPGLLARIRKHEPESEAERTERHRAYWSAAERELANAMAIAHQGVEFLLHLVNTNPALLLPGPVSVIRDGEFTGTIPLSLLPAGADFDLYVGQDDSIKAERKETLDKRSETGILNKRTVEDRTYRISIHNFHTNPIKLLIYDQFPVSKTADIVVNQGKFSDNPATIDKDSGKLTWNIELEPNTKKVIEFSYSVDWPKGKELPTTCDPEFIKVQGCKIQPA
jgi:hypothetical protein